MADVNEMTDEEFKKYISDVINKNFEESVKNDDKNSKIEHQDLSKTNEFLEKVNEFIKQIQEDTKKNAENNESLNDKIEEIGSNKLEAIKVNTENSLNSIDDMFNAVRAMGLLLGGVLNCNETMAQFCLKMGDELNKSKEGTNLSNVNAITGNNSEYVNEWLEYDDKSGIWVKHTLNEELPVVKKGDEDSFFGNSFDPYYSDNDKTKMLMAGLASGSAAKAKMSIADETLKREADALSKSKFAKEITKNTDPIGETSSNIGKLLKTAKGIKSQIVSKSILIGGLLSALYGVFYVIPSILGDIKNIFGDVLGFFKYASFENFKKIFTSDSFKNAAVGIGLAVLTVGGGLLATAIGIGIAPLKGIASAILNRLMLMRNTSNNVPIDAGGNGKPGAKGFKGRMGSIGRSILGGVGGIAAAIGVDMLFTKIGELIAGEDGGRVGSALGIGGSVIAGETVTQMITKGVGPKAALKAFPIAGGVISAAMSGFEAVGHLGEAGTYEKMGQTSNRNKSLVQSAISIAGPVIGGIVGSFAGPAGTALGISIGSMLSSGVNALIENTKTTEENTDASLENSKAQSALMEQIQLNNSDENAQFINTPQDSIQRNDEFANCITDLKLSYEGQSKELINALAEKDSRVRNAKHDYLSYGTSEYEIEIDTKMLKSLSYMNENLKNICENTKGTTKVGFDFGI